MVFYSLVSICLLIAADVWLDWRKKDKKAEIDYFGEGVVFTVFAGFIFWTLHTNVFEVLRWLLLYFSIRLLAYTMLSNWLTGMPWYYLPPEEMTKAQWIERVERESIEWKGKEISKARMVLIWRFALLAGTIICYFAVGSFIGG